MSITKKGFSFVQRQKQFTFEDDFRTPSFIFEYLNSEYGEIEYDGACIAGLNNLAIPLRLEQEWPKNSIVYSNPPFDSKSLIKWIKKGYDHTLNGGKHIVLMPNKTCQVFFNELYCYFDKLIFLGGRLDFSGPYSSKGGTSMQGTIIGIQTPKNSLLNYPNIEALKIRDLKRLYS